MPEKDVKLYANIKVEKLPDSEAAVTGEITAEALAYFRPETIKHFQNELEIPGFRKGHAPEKLVLDKLGELTILEEAGEQALKKGFPEIMRQSQLDTIGAPQIAITKLAIGSPLSFKITVAVFPEFTLPDYKSIAKNIAAKQEMAIVTDKELGEAINTIVKMRKKNEPAAASAAGEPPHLAVKPPSGGEIPGLTDELVKTLGKFENVDDFKNKMRESIKGEKEFRAKEKTRLGIIKEIIEKSDIPLPKVLVEGELDRVLRQIKDDIERMGLKVADYLKRLNKTESDLRKEWQKDAAERSKMELILDKIAKLENISATNEEVEREIKHLLEHYAKADPIQAASYFRHVITNEKVFQFLENRR